jgi:hypothetical protein
MFFFFCQGFFKKRQFYARWRRVKKANFSTSSCTSPDKRNPAQARAALNYNIPQLQAKIKFFCICGHILNNYRQMLSEKIFYLNFSLA